MVTNPTPITWFQAEQACMELYGSHLASITTQDEVSLVRGLILEDPDATPVRYITAWIGLNRFVGELWKWSDGRPCNYSFWNSDLIKRPQITDECALMDEEGFFNVNQCLVGDPPITSYLCNALPSVDYICVNRDGVWRFVMQYHSVYEYRYHVNNSMFKLQWDIENYGWYFILPNNVTTASCDSDGFVLPYECDNWQWVDPKLTLEFVSCPC